MKPYWLLPGAITIALFLAAVTSTLATPADRRSQAIQALARVPSGEALLARAQKAWLLTSRKELLDHLKLGDVSRTDAVLTRHLDAKTGEERRDRQVTIYVRGDQPLDDLILDIAHELVHATSRPQWDPYDPLLTPGKYIHAAIEGEGGEVEAVVAECQVNLELSGSRSKLTSRCASYLGDGADAGKIAPEKVRRDFYRVGKWRAELIEKLGKEAALFKLLTSERPKLYSSTGHSPYPVALYAEYLELNEVACRNTLKRLGAVETHAARSLSSTTSFLAGRCR